MMYLLTDVNRTMLIPSLSVLEFVLDVFSFANL